MERQIIIKRKTSSILLALLSILLTISQTTLFYRHQIQGNWEKVRFYMIAGIFLLSSLSLQFSRVVIYINSSPFVFVMLTNTLTACYYEINLQIGDDSLLEQQTGILVLVGLNQRFTIILQKQPRLFFFQFCYLWVRILIRFFNNFDISLLLSAMLVFLFALFIFNIMEEQRLAINKNFKPTQMKNEAHGPISQIESLPIKNNEKQEIRTSRRNTEKELLQSQIQGSQVVSNLISSRQEQSSDRQRFIFQQQGTQKEQDITYDHLTTSKIFENFHEGILILDQMEKVVSINSKCFKLFECEDPNQVVEHIKMLIQQQNVDQSQKVIIR